MALLDRPIIQNKKALLGWMGAFWVLIFVVGSFFYRIEKDTLQRERLTMLETVSQILARDITAWYQDELFDADHVSRNPLMTERVREAFKGRPGGLSVYLSSLQIEHDYDAILLTDPSGRVICSTYEKDTSHVVEPEVLPVVQKAFQDKRVVPSGIYPSRVHRQLHIDWCAPVFDGNRPMGVLLFRMNPERVLSPRVDYPFVGRTAETFLVQRRGDSTMTFIRPSRLAPNLLFTTLPLTRQEFPAVQAALGREGVFEGVDEQGRRVVAMIRTLPGTDWGLVLQVDRRELFSELRYRVGTILLVVSLLVLLVALAFLWVYHVGQRNLFRALYITEKALLDAQEEFRTTLYSIGDAVLITDLSGIVRHMNPMAESLTGWTETEATGRPISEVFRILNEKTREPVDDPVARVIREGVVVGLANHTVLVSKEGREIPIADSASPVRDGTGRPVGVVLVFRDQTAERAMVRALRESNQLLQTILDTVPVRVFWKDRQSRYLGCNLPFARDAGMHSPEELLGKDDFEMGWREQAELYRADDRAVIETGVPKLGYEEPQTTPEGRLIWLRTSKVPLRDAEGNIIGVLGTYEDITESKRRNEALRESEERYRSLFENNHAVMLVIDPDGGAIVDANPAAAAYYGWSRETLRTMRITDINTLPPEAVRAEMDRARNEQRTHFFFKHRRADGSIRDVEVFSGPIQLGGRKLLYSIVHDITERRKAEEALQISRARLALAQKIARLGSWELDMEAGEGYWSDEMFRLFGLEPAEKAPTFAEFLAMLHPEDREIPVEAERRIRETGEPIEITLRSHPDRGPVRTFTGHVELVRHRDGRMKTVGTLLDITALKEAEKNLRALLEEKEVLLREIHHRVKNNLAIISSLMNLQAREVKTPEGALAALSNTRDRVSAMALVHERLYQAENLTAVGMKGYVETVVHHLLRSSAVAGRVTLQMAVEDVSLEVGKAIPCGMILNELITNAVKHAFVGRKGVLRVVLQKRNDREVLLEVGDDGHGLPPSIGEEGKEGSLGLRLVRMLTGQLGGHLEISREGGTTFRIVFPLPERLKNGA